MTSGGRVGLVLLMALGLLGCGREPDPKQAEAAKHVVPLDLAGCSNAYKVSNVLYRGAQPSAKGFKKLATNGIKTIVNLRSSHSDRKALEGVQVDYIEIPIEAWEPRPEHVEQFLGVVTDPNRQPVFVHCQHGADRTGAMVAAYRVVVQGWSKDKALNEMTVGPFGFHTIWRDLPGLVRDLDVTALRSKLDLPEPTAGED